MEWIILIIAALVIIGLNPNILSSVTNSISNATNALGSSPVYGPFKPTITPTDAITQAWKLAKKSNPRDSAVGSPWYTATAAGILAGNMDTEVTRLQQSGTCAGAGNSGVNELKLTQLGGKLALSALPVISTTAGLLSGATISASVSGSAIAGTTLAAAIPVAGIIIAGIVGIFTLIAAHHAAAVANENNTICVLIPAANNYLHIIIDGVNQGLVTPQDASAALDSLIADFYSAARNGKAGQLDNTGGVFCNALCEYWIGLNAYAIYYKNGYQSMIVPVSAPIINTQATQSIAKNQPVGGSYPITPGPSIIKPISTGAPVVNPPVGLLTIAPVSTMVVKGTIATCGARPIRKNYDNSADYLSDVKDWNACINGV